MATLSNFLRNSILFSIVIAPTYIATTVEESSLFFTSCPAFICRLFDGHSNWGKVVPHCSFDLHFAN